MYSRQEAWEICKSSDGYSILVAKVREYQKMKYSLEESVDMACEYCIKHDILRDFLIKHRSEVGKVLLTEYNEREQRRLDRRDAYEDGETEGKAKGELLKLITQIQIKCKKGKSLHEVAEALEEDANDLNALYELVKENEQKTADEILRLYKK